MRPVTELLFEVSLAFKRTLVRAAASEDLSPPQSALLWELAPGRPMPMNVLAEALECDAANVTGLADILERRGLVVRSSAETDRRVKLLATTREGAQVRARLVARLLDPPPWLAALDAADLEALRDVLTRAKALVGDARLDAPMPKRT